MTTIQARRKLIVIILLSVAIAGALLRSFTAPRTTAHDVGTLLMLLWLPIIGNIISWLVSKLRRPAAAGSSAPSGFGEGRAFQPHALVELTLRAPQLPSEDVPIPAGEQRCHLVVDNEAFSARWFVRPDESIRRGKPQPIEVEFLVPALALRRFQDQAAFRILVGESFVGDGRVLRLLGEA